MPIRMAGLLTSLVTGNVDREEEFSEGVIDHYMVMAMGVTVGR